MVFKVDRPTKLLEFLLTSPAAVKKTVLKQRLKHGAVSVNGRVETRFDHALGPGDEVRVETRKAGPAAGALEFNLEIFYEDDSLLVVSKPAGLLTIATDKIQRRTAIHAVNDYLNQKAAARARRPRYGKRAFIVHRLDRDVSGLLLFAKSEEVKLWLQENWHRFTKEYLAVVEGSPGRRSGTLSSYLEQNKILRVFSSSPAAGPGGKWAVTHFEVLKPGEKYSLLKVRLETGRKHQIRVHLSDLGHPVAGDKDYGAKTDPLARIALHAWRLQFTHPLTGKNLVLTSPLPVSLERLL